MTPWTATPTARALLAEAAANPPATRIHRDRFGDTHETATGRVARELRKLWMAALDEALRIGDETGDHSAFDQLADLTPEVAIERAVAHTNSASADQGGKRHVESSALRAPVEPDAPVARTAGRAEHPTAPRRSTSASARRAA